MSGRNGVLTDLPKRNCFATTTDGHRFRIQMSPEDISIKKRVYDVNNRQKLLCLNAASG